ncbi:protein of unknown function [Chitinophaga jiangningensis]|uniref:DUF4251 domain-containing protein n=1 Tax=Chitinophaga jiangningensis TaxID=1419482 RepID=A0A1M7M0X3_9BACT|nr:DUF4251 domain-containing protein [Chitinophaga jiangningensis]SHM84226.1 protein of unknown function [Chitinophaga jiangningensis]
MKRMIIHVMLFTGLITMGLTTTISAQQKETRAEREAAKAAQVKGWVDAKQYVFVPQSAIPMGGRVVQLTGEFFLSVTKDSLVSYLPYYGRAYTAPMDPSKNSMDFKSKSFDYSTADRKKGGWDITIRPKDNRDVATINLSVSESGYGTLQVTSNSKQPISYNGYLREKKDKKAKNK